MELLLCLAPSAHMQCSNTRTCQFQNLMMMHSFCPCLSCDVQVSPAFSWFPDLLLHGHWVTVQEASCLILSSLGEVPFFLQFDPFLMTGGVVARCCPARSGVEPCGTKISSCLQRLANCMYICVIGLLLQRIGWRILTFRNTSSPG